MATADPSKAVRLLVRPSPFKGESLRGYLLRVGESNGLNDFSLLKYLTKPAEGFYGVPTSVLEHIAQALSLSLEQVEFINYRTADDGFVNGCVFFGHTISLSHLRGNQPAVCPECLADQQATSGLWDLKAVNACHRHGKWLIDQCQSCGQSLSWGRRRVSYCRCGFDLRASDTKAAPYEVLALTAILSEVVYQDLPATYEGSLGYPDEFRRTALNEMLGLFRYSESLLRQAHSTYERLHKNFSRVNNKYARATMFMSEILKDWPNRFWVILARFSKHDASEVVLSNKQFHLSYGHVMRIITEQRSFGSVVPEFFKQALKQFKDEHYIRNFLGKSYLNPSTVWLSSEGIRVMRTGDCIKALDMRLDEKDYVDVTPFSHYLEIKRRKYPFGW